MKNAPKISIIIPFAASTEFISESVKKCLALNYPDFEIVVLPDGKYEFLHPKVKVISTGHVPPGKKRNLGVNASTGEIIAFIDDDAYPHKDWLANAVKYFDNPKIGVVGGPGITPEQDTIEQKASGFVWGSLLGSGPIAYRNRIENTRFVDDYPTCNFLIRKNVFEKIGGFDESYWRGEDTLLCREVLKKDMKILYASDTIVFHHRRKMFSGHLKQIWKCGEYRGFFAKKFPENSSNYYYFIPTLLAIAAPVAILLDIFIFKSSVFVLLFLIYLISIAVLTLPQLKNGIKFYFLAVTGIILTHFAYGYSFIRGYLSRGFDR